MNTGYFGADDCDLTAFEALVSRTTDAADVPNAVTIQKNIPVYDGASLDAPGLMAEWNYVLGRGAGALAIKGAYRDTAAIDAATSAYMGIIADEKEANAGRADHFAPAGANDRIWNSLQKLCEADPDTFVRYFGNRAIAMACEAWLGPDYQMTAQVNLVYPGGSAQQAHRDYHLGFQPVAKSVQYPVMVHELSAALTLQGAIAHCDMPLESGPTKLLPFSQMYGPGYVAYHRPDFRDLFEERHVQIPLEKGDCLFFNPAIFHAAGANRSADIKRLANLVQISSAFGRAMEDIDRDRMCRLIYPALRTFKKSGQMSAEEIDAAIAATAEGYAFPTNLDTDPPVGAHAPDSQADMMRAALAHDQSPEDLDTILAARTNRRRA